MSQADCLFCRIVAHEVSADIVAETERLLAFRDINPQAPTHLLVIPKEHVASLHDASDVHAELLGEAMLLVAELAREEGVSDAGYRTVVNTGDEGGQTVHHLHIHLLGGRSLTWPPG